MKFSAYIFDLDGTLIDSEVLWVESTQLLLAERGIQVSLEEAVKVTYGVPWPTVQVILAERYPTLNLSLKAMLAAANLHFDRLCAQRDLQIPGSVALLKRLAKEWPVAIVSGSQRYEIAAAANHMGISDLLAFYLGGDDYHQQKPDPVSYLMAAERFGLEPAQIVVFEDSTMGIRAAKAAGMYCIALQQPNRPQQDTSQADEVLEDLTQFQPR